LFPSLRATWAAIGTQAKVSITGQNAGRVLFSTIKVRTASIDDLADRASQWVLSLTSSQARRRSGMASSKFWLRSLSQHFWQPTYSKPQVG